jgi:beta-galactosidase
MKQYIAILAVALTALTASAQQRSVESLNNGWLFSRDSLFQQSEQIDVPHDFQIAQPWVAPAADEKADNSDAAANIKSRLSARGFKEIGTGWYKKTLQVSRSTLKGKRVLLDFEGIMLTADVYLNGQRIGGTDYGYVGFQIDVTNLLKDGSNTLVVKAETQNEKASRWYTGGGLFRNVSLVTTSGELYLERHPLYITTRDNRYVTVGVEFTNRGRQKEVCIGLKIYDPDGQCVYQSTENSKRLTASRTQEYQLREVDIPQPRLWDTDHPNLYRAEVTLMHTDGTITDSYSEHFGIRTIEIGPEFGLKLNGRKVLLKGYANHHTLGALGAAAYPRAIEKRLQLMKEFGMNHIRTSHNPYSRQFVELCDRYGMLVVDELYDKWTNQHTGSRAPFMNHWASDITEWVKRDRNSPSVVLWSLGNELQQDPNQPFNDFGVTCYRMMRPVLQRYDSTRLVTVAMHPRYRNWQTDSLPCDLAMQTDVQAYNYRYMYFPGDSRRFPWMTFYQSEASTQAMGQNFFEMDLDRVIGLAYWGAIDYLGESMGWPAKGWAQGVFYIDLTPKPKAYYMRSFFKPEEPLVHLGILESENAEMWNGVKMGNDRMTELWNRPDGSKANIYIYTNCDEVELRLNGKSLGRKPNPTGAKLRNQLRWGEINYQKGCLEAIGYRGSKAVARHALETTGKAVRIIAEPDNSQWLADGQDLQHIRLRAVDSKGRTVLTCQDELTFSVSGDAHIVAVTNGDITSDELNTTNHRRLWQGQAMVILRAGRAPSAVTLTTQPTTLKAVTTKLQTATAR